MADFHVLTGSSGRVDFPAVRTIGIGDLIEALRLGWRDFWQKPSHLVFLGLIYPLVGAAIGLWTSGSNSWPLLFPLISGFALIGPLAALPIYEMSRRQELGLDTHWSSALGVLRSAAMPSIVAVGIFLLALFTVWLMVAQFLYESLFGPGSPPTLAIFLDQVFNTAPGQSLMIWGNLIGFGFAVFLAIGVMLVVVGGRFLEFPSRHAGTLILVVEAAATISIALILLALFVGNVREGAGTDAP